MTRLLVAASSGITNKKWIDDCLSASIKSNEIEIIQFSDHSILSASLVNFKNSSKALIRSNGENRRSEIRQALHSADHLLLLWDGRTLNNLLFEARLCQKPTKIFAIETTLVVNKDRGDDFDVYIGRGTPWGNPFPVGKLEGQYERDESIALYKTHFEKNILANPSLRKGLLGLRGMRLACHCKPLACHGDVIVNYLNSIDPNEDLTTE